MALTTGKRKRDASLRDSKPAKTARTQEQEQDDADLRTIFQRAFEAKFKPLAVEKKVGIEETLEQEVSDEDNSQDEDDWEGFSEDEDEEEHAVEVIAYDSGANETSAQESRLSKKEMKDYMRGKVPTTSSTTTATSTYPTKASKKGDPDSEDRSESLNLKNDIALQRLLSESHLLSSSTSSQASNGTAASAGSLEATGKNRLRALDLRMQALGAKSSTFDPGKMPMNMRKHLTASKDMKEKKRRADAREGGIILEKEKRKAADAKERKRERGVGGASVGKYKGGMLVLSKRDVRSIEGPREVFGKGKKGKKGRR